MEHRSENMGMVARRCEAQKSFFTVQLRQKAKFSPNEKKVN